MLSEEARRYWAEKRAIQEARKFQPVKCKYCGHKDTKAELKQRRLRKCINDEPRLYCSRKCQQAAWERENGARRKREYRARQKNVPTVRRALPSIGTASGQDAHVPTVVAGDTKPSGNKELSAAINNWKASAGWLLRKRMP